MAKFKQASGSILGDLQGTYQFLLDGLEDMALETLHAVAEVAKDMATAADQLHNDFDEESQRVEKAPKHVVIKKDSEEVRKKDILEKAKELEVDTKLAKQRKETAEEDYKMCEERYKKAEANKEALEVSASNSFKAIANVLVAPLTLVTGSNVFNSDADLDSNSQLAREEKLLHLEEMKKQREIRSKALQDIAEFTKQIENCEDDANLAEVAIGALHKPMSGLQQLSAIMMKTALFWKQIQVHCEQLAKEKMQRMITMAMKRTAFVCGHPMDLRHKPSSTTLSGLPSMMSVPSTWAGSRKLRASCMPT